MEEFSVGGVPVKVVTLSVEPKPSWFGVALYEATVGSEKKQASSVNFDKQTAVINALNEYYRTNV